MTNLYPGYNSTAAQPPRPMPAAWAQSRGSWVLGVAGGGLIDAKWAVNADVAAIGRKGEIRTAEILDGLSSRSGAAVLHDLRIPIPTFTANIDHVVVSGNRVLLVDSKAWAPGFFWTVSGHTRRGLKSFPSADKQTMSMAYEAIGRYLGTRHLDARIELPVVTVWPTSERKHASFWAMRFPGAAVVRGDKLAHRVDSFIGRKPANALIVAALAQLLNAPPERSSTSTTFDF